LRRRRRLGVQGQRVGRAPRRRPGPWTLGGGAGASVRPLLAWSLRGLGIGARSRDRPPSRRCRRRRGRAAGVSRRWGRRARPPPDCVGRTASYTRTKVMGWDGPKGFAGVDRPEAWPRLRGSARPERLDAGLDTLPGVGPRIAARLRRLGLGTIRDLLE